MRNVTFSLGPVILFCEVCRVPRSSGFFLGYFFTDVRGWHTKVVWSDVPRRKASGYIRSMFLKCVSRMADSLWLPHKLRKFQLSVKRWVGSWLKSPVMTKLLPRCFSRIQSMHWVINSYCYHHHPILGVTLTTSLTWDDHNYRHVGAQSKGPQIYRRPQTPAHQPRVRASSLG